MRQEEKQLLLKDLCARLPYGVKCVFHGKDGCIPSTILRVDVENEFVMFANRPDTQKDKSSSYLHLIEHIKPYLRPMSSMTEEEKEDYVSLSNHCVNTSVGFAYLEAQVLVEWLNFHHFDYRGLIEKSLAIIAPEGMYKTE